MVSRALGRSVSLSKLRHDHPGLSRGGTLRDLIEIGKDNALNARALKVPLTKLGHVLLPCILHWDFNHFVVLERISGKHFDVVDPAQGRTRLHADEFAEHYTGIAVEITPLAEGPANGGHPAARKSSRILGLTPYLRPIIQVASIAFFVLFFSLITPLIIQIIVDEVIVANDYDLLTIVCVVFLFAHLTAAIANYMQQMQIARLTSRTRHSITIEYLDRLLSQNWSYFSSLGLGTFVAQYTSLGLVVTTFISTVGLFATNVLYATFTTVVLFLIEPAIAAIIAAISGGVVLARLVVISKSRQLEDEAIRAAANEEAYFVETMRGITSVHANRLEPKRMASGVDHTVDAINTTFKVSRFKARFALLKQVLKAAELILVIYFLSLAVMDGAMTIGVMYVFYTYRQFLDGQLSSAVTGLSDILNLRVHVRRLEPVLSLSNKSDRTIAGAVRLLGDVTFKDVHYAIDNGRTPVIASFSGEIPHGKFAMIQGPTGAGKTTLLRIVLQMTTADKGQVEFDGMPINEAMLSTLRNNVGVVLQEDTLFRGSIAENVAQFDEFLDFDRILECCRIACVEDDVRGMPMGLMTDVGDLGSNMSTGQQQRLLMARALYKDPPILALDEATANLNLEMEENVISNIKSLHKTVIFASHSLVVRRHADIVWDLPLLAARSVLESSTTK